MGKNTSREKLTKFFRMIGTSILPCTRDITSYTPPKLEAQRRHALTNIEFTFSYEWAEIVDASLRAKEVAIHRESHTMRYL